CCCPMEFYGLKIAETQSALKAILLFSDSLGSFSCEGDLRAYSRSLLGQANQRVSCAGPGSGRGNRDCFFTRFVVKKARLWRTEKRGFSGSPRGLGPGSP